MLTLFLSGAIVCWLAHNVSYDLLVRQQYLAHKRKWEKDGRPEGFFWRSPEAPSYLYRKNELFSRNRWLLLWIMPDWVNRDAYAWRLLYCHRVACGLLLAAITGFLSETLWQDMFQ